MSDQPTAPFQPAKAKLTIGSLDDPEVPTGLQVEAHYNPKELQVDKTVPWTKVNQANQANNDGIHLEFTGAEGRSMSVEMLFDGYETNGMAGKKTVSQAIADLEKLASVIDPTSTDENKRRPRRCVVSWGSGMPSFRCVIESISTKYTMMTTDGVPLRATVQVKLKEADVVSAAKAAGAANPGGAKGATGAPAGGTAPSGGTAPGGGTPSGGTAPAGG